MNVLIIGHYSIGSTTRMRGESIERLLPSANLYVVDIDEVFNKLGRLSKTIGWRFKVGPLITGINTLIQNRVSQIDFFDFVWVDKGVFLYPKVLENIRKKTAVLIHYTPDPAFLYHRSRLFLKSIPTYDYCITTKSFELELYAKFNARKVLLSSQGYDPSLHKPYYSSEQKKGVSFIGHYEPNRARVIQSFIDNGIEVILAGIKWEKFVSENLHNKSLTYLGKGVYGEDYARVISRSKLSLGFLSRIIPELHTTRTFEIPACKTVLITEENAETSSFFKENEVVFYLPENEGQLYKKVQEMLNDDKLVEQFAELGYQRIIKNDLSFDSLMKKMLDQCGVNVDLKI